MLVATIAANANECEKPAVTVHAGVRNSQSKCHDVGVGQGRARGDRDPESCRHL
jgi:hypothetical protein